MRNRRHYLQDTQLEIRTFRYDADIVDTLLDHWRHDGFSFGKDDVTVDSPSGMMTSGWIFLSPMPRHYFSLLKSIHSPTASHQTCMIYNCHVMNALSWTASIQAWITYSWYIDFIVQFIQKVLGNYSTLAVQYPGLASRELIMQCFQYNI